MINHVANYGNMLSIYFDTVEEKVLFKSRVEGLKGITIEKENNRKGRLQDFKALSGGPSPLRKPA